MTFICTGYGKNGEFVFQIRIDSSLVEEVTAKPKVKHIFGKTPRVFILVRLTRFDQGGMCAEVDAVSYRDF